MTATASTEQRWRERVRAWRASGQTAAAFVVGKGYAASTLRMWATRLGETERRPRVVRVVPRQTSGGAAAAVPAASEVVVDVGAARVRVRRGFDRELLVEVVRALEATR